MPKPKPIAGETAGSILSTDPLHCSGAGAGRHSPCDEMHMAWPETRYGRATTARRRTPARPTVAQQNARGASFGPANPRKSEGTRRCPEALRANRVGNAEQVSRSVHRHERLIPRRFRLPSPARCASGCAARATAFRPPGWVRGSASTGRVASWGRRSRHESIPHPSSA
jgi:hypothetical protein